MTEATIGHNSTVAVAVGQLKSVIDRIESLEEGIQALNDERKDVYAEAKSNGYDVKALRTIVRMRKQDPDKRAEQEAILEAYQQALGMP